MREARQDMGPDALLMESRLASNDTRHLGRYEVVFGAMTAAPAPATAGPQPQAVAPREEVNAELKMMRGQIDELKRLLQPTAVPPTTRSEGDDIRDELIAADIEPSVASGLVDTALTIWSSAAQTPRNAPAAAGLRNVIRECIHRRLQGSTSEERTIVFVGPTGAGKTTSIIKFAIQNCLAQRRSVRIISVDTDRVGTHERMKTLCAISGIGFAAANSIAEFDALANEKSNREYTLIDTPGFSDADVHSARELALAVNRIARKEVQLVLPAPAKRGDLEKYISRFAAFQASRILLTKLDDTDSYGAALSVAFRAGTPFSFFATGQSIPEDLEAASIQKLTTGLFAPQAERAASAA